MGIAAAALLSWGCDDGDSSSNATGEDAGATEVGNLTEVAAEAGQFGTLLSALEAANLVDTLAGEGPYTVFAPTDEAFAALPEGTLDALLSDTDALREVLLYHVADGRLAAADVAGSDAIATLNGEDAPVTVDGDTVRIGDATITQTDIEASNGVIHVIDRVLVPEVDEPPMPEGKNIVETAMDDDRFSTLVTAVEAAGLVDTLSGEGPFTVFAPTNDAFAALPEGTLDALLADPQGALTDVLLYHVVADSLMAADVAGRDAVTTVQGEDAPITVDEDGTVRIAGAAITVTDIEATNGVIHVIDMVITPPVEPPMEMDIIEIASGNDDFSTLVTAVEAAGLVETLQGEGPFTVFAPTNDAFAALPEGTLDALLADPQGALTDVLLYHVVADNLLAEDVAGR
jgi:uncharacterized surface protein with fasciclin (FAS1) repeats